MPGDFYPSSMRGSGYGHPKKHGRHATLGEDSALAAPSSQSDEENTNGAMVPWQDEPSDEETNTHNKGTMVPWQDEPSEGTWANEPHSHRALVAYQEDGEEEQRKAVPVAAWRCCGGRCCVFFALLVTAALVLIAVPVISALLSGRNDDREDAPPPPEADQFAINPDQDALEYLRSIISPTQCMSSDAPSRIQNNAIMWLSHEGNDAGLIDKKDEAGLIERYTMALLFYSFSTYHGIEESDSHDHDYYESNDLTQSWLSNEDVCQWKGVHCDGPGDAVDYLELPGLDLSGNIPTEIACLTALTWLWLSANNFKGTIPTHIGLLKDLSGIWLDINDLTGAVPYSAINGLSKLTLLDLANNELTGTLPRGPDLSELTGLQTLSMWNNTFSGTIPANLGKGMEASLRELWLGNNPALTGKLPAGLSSLTELTWLTFPNNTLTGTLPVELVLGLTKLTALDLASNQFAGSIPAALEDLSDLKTLDMSKNQLTGTIPLELGNFLEENLQDCSLTGNSNLQGIPDPCL